MNYIVIRNSSLEGRYELDTEGRPFNTHEHGWITKLSGVNLLQPNEPEVLQTAPFLTAVATIALIRAGKAQMSEAGQTYDQLAYLPFDGETISLEEETEEAEEEVPPTSPPSSSGSSDSLPTASPPSLETLVLPPKSSGTHGWDTSEYAPPRSAS